VGPLQAPTATHAPGGGTVDSHSSESPAALIGEGSPSGACAQGLHHGDTQRRIVDVGPTATQLAADGHEIALSSIE